MKEKFEAYQQVQELGVYNMLDPRAKHLAQEMFCEQEITKKDWVYIIQNYETLKQKYA